MEELERIVAMHSQKAQGKSLAKQCTVSFHGLKRAQTTIEDFTKTYFPLHDLSALDFFKYLPILTFVEATIYQMDEENEQVAKTGVCEPESKAQVESETVLKSVLQEEGLWDSKIEHELNAGELYWQQERYLCSRVLHHLPITVEEIFKCSEAKSFDYRVLHLLLHKLIECEVQAALFEFMFYTEHLVEIQDDLFDFEKDVSRNSFNIYRMLIYCLGKKEAQIALIKRIGEFEAKQAEAFRGLSSAQQEAFKQREKEAQVEFGIGATKWVFPVS